MTEPPCSPATDGSAVDMSVITLRHPQGSVRLNVPTDIAIGELMPDFLDVTQQPDGDDWLIGPEGGHPYRLDRTLADLEVADGMILVLRERIAAAAWSPALSHGSVDRRHEVASDRPVSSRTARTLPERLSSAARARVSR